MDLANLANLTDKTLCLDCQADDLHDPTGTPERVNVVKRLKVLVKVKARGLGGLDGAAGLRDERGGHRRAPPLSTAAPARPENVDETRSS